MTRACRIVFGYLLLAFTIWYVHSVGLFHPINFVIHSLSLILWTIIAVPAGALLFLVAIVSIPNRLVGGK